MLCEIFFHKVAGRKTKWDKDIIKRLSPERNLKKKLLGDWLDIAVLGERTEVIGQMMFYPFIVTGHSYFIAD